MRILLFPSAFHPSLGGVEELTRQLGRQLLSAGHCVSVVTNRWPRNLPVRETVDGLQLYRLALRTPGSGLKSELTYRLYRHRARQQFDKLLGDFRADIIHAICICPGIVYGLGAAGAARIPVVATIQGELTMDASGLYERSSPARDAYRRALRESVVVTACSSHSLSEAEAFDSAFYNRRVGRVVANGVELSEFENVTPFKHTKPYVLAMGRHVTQKGFDMLIDAWAVVGDGRRILLIAGDGPERSALEAQAASVPGVYFIGRVNREMAASLYAGCDAFVLPSRHEPFGIVLLEAMASGKPVVATRVGGVPEVVVDNETGVLVEPNAFAIADGLRRILANDDTRQQMGERGTQRAKLFNWKRITGEYIRIYEEACLSSNVLVD